VTPAGAKASQLKVVQGRLRDRETLRVLYPDADVVYPALGRNSRTELRVNDDGTFDGQDDRRGRRVRISGSGGGTEAYADIAVSVPAGRSVALYLGAGKVTATNVDGQLSVDASSAEVRVSGGRGELSVDVGAGAVEVTGAKVDHLSVDTGSGNVTLTDVTSAALSIDTGSGDVTVSGASADVTSVDTGSGSIRYAGRSARTASFDTGSGDVTIDLAEDPGDISVDTGSGDVVLRLPANTGAQLALETSSGDIDTEFPVQVTRTGDDELRGTIGDGKGRIHVESGSGSVQLKKR
jgi:DUF4097 and DUF4098 domain-containing protein YvlB